MENNKGIRNARVYPGSMGVASLAIDLFGIDRVDPGSWTTPVYILDLDPGELSFAVEFFAEYGINVTPVDHHYR